VRTYLAHVILTARLISPTLVDVDLTIRRAGEVISSQIIGDQGKGGRRHGDILYRLDRRKINFATAKSLYNRVVLTSRSAIETFQRCPRKRFLEYHYDGRGIVPAVSYAPFSVGSAVHHGIELMLRGQSVDTAVTEALAGFPEEFPGYQPGEQRALAEALIRVADIVIVPWINREYEILSIEQEELFVLEPGIELMGRCDLVVVNKQDRGISIINFKTTSNHPTSDGRAESAIYHTLQGVTESMIVSQRLREEHYKLRQAIDSLAAAANNIKGVSVIRSAHGYVDKLMEHLMKAYDAFSTQVKSVRFVFLIKGSSRWQYDEEGNRKFRITYSPLIRAYMNSSGEYAHTFNLPDGKRLGRDWRPVNVWDTIGVQKWISMLANGEVQPELGDIIRRQVFIPYESYVKDWELEEVHKMILKQEHQVMEMLKDGMEAFPMYRHSCDYPTTCHYQDICYGKEQDPIGSGKYQYRVPHHSTELERINDAENNDSVW